MTSLKVAVLGGGHAGRALAGYLSLKGNDVSLYNRTIENVAAIRDAGGINVQGVVEESGTSTINLPKVGHSVDVHLRKPVGPYIHATPGNSEVELTQKTPHRVPPVPLLEALHSGVQDCATYNERYAPINLVSDRMDEIIPGQDILLVTVPAQAHKFYAREMSQWLEDGQTLLIMPGATGGAIEFSNILDANTNRADIILGEAQTFSFVSRIVDPHTVLLSKIKNTVRISALPAISNNELIESLNRTPLSFDLVENVLKTSLGNVNAMLHPAPMVLNAGLIESQCGGFLHYHNLISESVGSLIERMDKERINIARKFSLDSATLLEWLAEVYDAKGNTLCECIKSIDTYDAVNCATNLNHRYIHEDIPTGLVPISDIGRLVGIKTPAIDSIISMASQVCQQDFHSIGRSVESLGLSGMGIDEIREYVDVGIKQSEYLPIFKSSDLPVEDF